jgi:hypothetical protein
MFQQFFRGQKVEIVDGELKGLTAIVLWSHSDFQLDAGAYDDKLSDIFDVLIVDSDQDGTEVNVEARCLTLISDDRVAGEETIQEYKESVQASINAEIDEVEQRVRKEHPKLFFVEDK